MSRLFSIAQLAPPILWLTLLLFSPVTSIRLYKSRTNALAFLGEKEARIYMSNCGQSSSRPSCTFSIDAEISQEPTQCALTLPESRPWWMAELESPAYISKVTVLNMDLAYMSFPDALTSMVLFANDYACFRFESTESFVKRTFPCDAIGDQITIQSNLDDAVMAVCDVEVIGALLRFPTVLGKSSELTSRMCQQSSVDGTSYCNYAFDGKTAKPCSVTVLEQSPWIEALLSKPSLVYDVLIVSGQGGMESFRITLNSRLCADYLGAPFESKAFICNLFGDILRIESSLAKPLSVCEIQLLGHEAAIVTSLDYKFVGCHNDKHGDHDLAQLVSSTRMKPAKCHQICKRLAQKFFGLQNGRHCFCGSSFGKHGKADDPQCNVKCEADEFEFCGGPMHNSVYEII